MVEWFMKRLLCQTEIEVAFYNIDSSSLRMALKSMSVRDIEETVESQSP